jgi:hypothetical protein
MVKSFSEHSSSAYTCRHSSVRVWRRNLLAPHPRSPKSCLPRPALGQPSHHLSARPGRIYAYPYIRDILPHFDPFFGLSRSHFRVFVATFLPPKAVVKSIYTRAYILTVSRHFVPPERSYASHCGTLGLTFWPQQSVVKSICSAVINSYFVSQPGWEFGPDSPPLFSASDS